MHIPQYDEWSDKACTASLPARDHNSYLPSNVAYHGFFDPAALSDRNGWETVVTRMSPKGRPCRAYA